MLNAKNDAVQLPGGRVDYLCFGSGPQTLVMIPGLGDGLKTVRGMAVPFALMYRKLARQFTVYVFSCRDPLPEPCTTETLAEALGEAMALLGLRETCLLGVSMGGMIAQRLALKHPELISRLILTVSLGRPNDTVREALDGWIAMAERGDYRSIMLDTAKRSYSEAYLKKARLSYGLLGDLGKPKSFDRFLALAGACRSHDCSDRLGEIACPTLVIGGAKDRVVGPEAAKELAEAIPGAELFVYSDYSHGLYEEAGDFLDRVTEFFTE